MIVQSSNSAPTKSIRIERGLGEFFWDSKGNRYIDVSSQTMNLLLGQSNKEINEVIKSQLDELTFVDQDFCCSVYDQAIAELFGMVPAHLDVVNLRMSDGSSAVECAIKMASKATGKTTILTMKGIYLGQTAQTILIRGWGQSRSEIMSGLRQPFIHAPSPRPNFNINFDSAPDENGDSMRALIREHKDELSCIILDPVMISDGVTMGRGLDVLIRKSIAEARMFSIPVILDECQTFGWVPGYTLSNFYKFEPDFLILGKGIGGGLPLSICLTHQKFNNLTWGDADFTNGGTLAAIRAMHKTCEILKRKDTRLHFKRLSLMLDEWGTALQRRADSKIYIRGVGLIRAINLRVSSIETENISVVKELSSRLLEKGIYIRSHQDCLTIKPPIVISEASLSNALQIIEDHLVGVLK